MEETLEEKVVTIKFICPHCNKIGKTDIHLHTDDENVISALELLAAFELVGEKDDQD